MSGGCVSIPFIDLKSQYAALKPQIHERIERVLEHGQYIMGPEVRELEERLEKYTGAKHCITVSSGTEALLISLIALGIKPGDEVITTPFSFISTVEVIVLLGATPVFVDIVRETCNIDVAKIEEKITGSTRAIMPVSLYGLPANMDEINDIANRNGGIPVIEDAAQSFGATYKGKKSCNLSHIGCTSFFPSKPLGCYGDGGAVFTSDDNIARACREIRVHGQSERYVHTRVGVGGRMDTLQCAIVLAKLDRFDWELEQRQRVAARYTELILAHQSDSSNNISRVPVVDSSRTSAFAQYTLQVDERQKLQAVLKASGIPTAVHYPVPLNEQPAYEEYCCSSNCTPVARLVSEKVISLPMHPSLGEEVQQRIVETLVAS